ncbi:MAG: CAP domain-containing protein [Minisyncoccales bacterium]
MKNFKEKIIKIFFPCQENNYYPYFLKQKFLNFYLFFLLFLKFFTFFLALFLHQNIFFALITKENLIKLVNEERAKYHLPALKENSLLERSSFLKAKDIFENNYFDHQSPLGYSPWHWFLLAGYQYQSAGENLAIGFLDSKEVFDAWLKSPSHRANILNRNFKEIGIWVQKGYFNGKEVYLVVQHFGAPKKIISQVGKKENVFLPSIIPSPILKEEKITQRDEKKEEKREVARTLPLVETKKITETKKTAEKKEEGKILSTVEKNDWTRLKKIEKAIVSFVLKYHHFLLQAFIYFSLFFLIFACLLTIIFDIFVYNRFVIDYKNLILRTLIFVFIFFLFLYFDYLKFLKLIPHDFSI